MRDRVKVRDRLRKRKTVAIPAGKSSSKWELYLGAQKLFSSWSTSVHAPQTSFLVYCLYTIACVQLPPLMSAKTTINNQYNEASPSLYTFSFLHWDVCHNTEEKSMQCHYLRFIASLNGWLHCDFKLASWFVAYLRWFTRFSWIYPQRLFSFPYCMYTSWGMCSTNTMTYWTHTHHSFCPARITLLWLNTTRLFCTPPTVNKISELW